MDTEKSIRVTLGEIIGKKDSGSLYNLDAGIIHEGVLYTNSSVVKQLIVKAREKRSKEEKPTNLYFIQGENGGPVKIGVSENVNQRLAQHQIGSPIKLVIIYTRFGSSKKEETKIHKKYSALHLHGEWFDESVLKLEGII